ncbi:MAG: 50S ribosomal protein L29 [Candidatus Sungbacteria bacterium]|nr:50S ribosomal protein L29 [Candidatus Sungbacteria bacterium]
MKRIDLSLKPSSELKTLLGERRGRANELRLLLHQRKIKNVKEMGLVKKDIARILTLLKQQATQERHGTRKRRS